MRLTWAIAFCCLFLMATSSLDAAGPSSCIGTKISGTITKIDTVNIQIVVDKTLVQITKATVIKERHKIVTFKYLKVGMEVKVCGEMKGPILYAKRIMIGTNCGGGGGGGGGGCVNKEEIVSIDPLTKQFTLDNKVVVQVNKKTVLKKGCKTITFDDLDVGDSVYVEGKVVGGVLIATLVKLCGGGGGGGC